MLRRMEQQAQHVRGQLLASDRSGLEQGAFARCAHLRHRTGERLVELPHQRSGIRGRVAGLRLDPRGGSLFRTQLLTSRVRQQPVERARQVAHVKPDRGRARFHPDLVRVQTVERVRRILLRVQQRVGDGHQQRGHAIERPAQPRFGQ